MVQSYIDFVKEVNKELPEYVNFIDRIKLLHPSFASFHLSPCGGCGAPAWMQPCPICSFYPMGDRSKQTKDREAYRKVEFNGFTVAENVFVKRVNKFGFIYWYCMMKAKTCSTTYNIEMKCFANKYKDYKIADAESIISIVRNNHDHLSEVRINSN